MPCEGFQSGGSGKPPSPPCQGCSARMLHCARGGRRQPGRGAWSGNRVSATGTSRAQEALVLPRPLFAGLTGEEGAGGGTLYSGLRPEPLRACP